MRKTPHLIPMAHILGALSLKHSTPKLSRPALLLYSPCLCPLFPTLRLTPLPSLTPGHRLVPSSPPEAAPIQALVISPGPEEPPPPANHPCQPAEPSLENIDHSSPKNCKTLLTTPGDDCVSSGQLTSYRRLQWRRHPQGDGAEHTPRELGALHGIPQLWPHSRCPFLGLPTECHGAPTK